MYEREIKCAETPHWHNLHKTTVPYKLRLDHRWKIAYPTTREKRGREAGKIIHR
jgi:hypothetical protein